MKTIGDLRNQFKEETGTNWENSQHEPDIDYVDWLEKKIVEKGIFTSRSKDQPNGGGEDRLKEKVENMIQELRDESLVDFMRASDRERVIETIYEFIQIQTSK